MTALPRHSPGMSVPAIRLVVGVVQGIALYLLYTASESGSWPATNGFVFAPLFLTALLVPVIVLTGAADMRGRTLTLWTVAAAVVLAGLALYDIWRGAESNGLWLLFAGKGPQARLFPAPILIAVSVLALFIAHSLIVAGDQERRFIASYPRYFDVAWKLEIQLLLSLGFIGVFWLLLHLGASLFELIKLDFLTRLLRHRWFSIPATTLALACAIHVTDVRTGITRGIQTLAHTLLSFLLPVMALIVTGFLVALPFTGLDPLWGTRHATSLLLAEAAALILLINATYQDGQADHVAPRLLRYAASLAAIVLTPLVAIAGYALFLRIAQYGWTSSRIISAACVVVAGCYALGYLWAVVAPGAWLKRLEDCNLVVSVVILAIVLALASPIADPARLSVIDQVARLRSGTVPADKFDFAYLRFEGARWGRAALERLKVEAEGEQAQLIKEKAAAALELQSPGQRLVIAPQAQDIAANITVFPSGRLLPASFIDRDWSANQTGRWLIPQCLTDKSHKCDAFFVALGSDGGDDIVLVEPGKRAVAFGPTRDGRWDVVGTLPCAGVLDALRAGAFKVVPPAWNDVEFDGHQLRLETIGNASLPQCP